MFSGVIFFSGDASDLVPVLGYFIRSEEILTLEISFRKILTSSD